MHQQGFTLMETLVTVLLIALLATLLLPPLQQWRHDARLAGQSRELAALFHHARNAALESGERLRLCGSRHAGKACDHRWDEAIVIDSQDRIHQRLSISDDLRVRWQGLGQDLILSSNLAASRLNGAFYICPKAPRARHAHRLVINRLGRLRRETHPAEQLC